MGMGMLLSTKYGFKGEIEKMTLENKDFRRVIYTAAHCQIVLMSLAPSEDIGFEIHKTGDQFFRFESGEGRVVINGHDYAVRAGEAVVVPAGARHNVTNASATEPLKMYTIYAPPHHRDGVAHQSKAAAQADKESFDGKVSP